MTKEIRMTNDENTARRGKSGLSFVLRHSFGIHPPRGSHAKAGRWSFVISSSARLLLVLLLALEISCVGRRLTKANVDEVTEGMSKKQVESILGPATNIDNKDFIIMKRTVYLYRQGKDTVTIVFKDDKVTDKQSTLSD
jgi:hypothetical protein